MRECADADEVNTRFGKRTPFIVCGTVVAAVALVLLSFVDAAQLKNIEKVCLQSG